MCSECGYRGADRKPRSAYQAAARTRLRAALAGFGEAKESLRDRTEHALATIGT